MYTQKRKSRDECELEYVGKEFPTKYWGNLTVIEYNTSKDVIVIFNNTNHMRKARMDNVSNGYVKDPTAVSIEGIASIGEMNPSLKGSRIRRQVYNEWKAMLHKLHKRGQISLLKPEYLVFANYFNWKRLQ